MFKRGYRKAYSFASNFILSKYCKLFTDGVILSASGYLMLKKLFEWSISGWLLNNAFHQPLVNVYVYASGVLLSTAIVVKVVSLLFEHFPPVTRIAVEPDEISDCLLVMNQEIHKHLQRLNPAMPVHIKALEEQHEFAVNVRIVVEALAEHIRRSIDAISIKRKDLFISLYTHCTESGSLKYELHYDPKRDLVTSKLIPLDDEKFAQYECVKCINSEASTAYVYEKKHYAKGNSKRHKTLGHYLGCKLGVNGQVFGFLNIEFHNHLLFDDEDQMEDFMEENIFPFKLLLEYQYLKRDFFQKFSDFETYWRAT